MIKRRAYTGGYGVSEDYLRLHDFLAKSGCTQFTYARFDWMITHNYLRVDNLKKIGLWEDNGDIVACTLFDTTLDDVYLVTLPEYAHLKRELMDYTLTYMMNDCFRLAIREGDEPLQRLALENGLIATPDTEMDAIYDLVNERGEKTPPPDPRPFLPEGYALVSLDEERDWRKYGLCMHKGFGHEERGEPFEYDGAREAGIRASMLREHVDLKLKIAVKAPNGEYAAYCGMWYDARAGFSVIEPVATIPECRRMGLGRAAVTEGIRLTGLLGARAALVGSSQQFYYSIGLRPLATTTFWKLRDKRSDIK